MGALLTAFQGRIPSQRRIELTNQGDETASSENTTVSGYAETDASNEFFHRTGVTFDSTNSEHLTIGVKGMVHFLYSYRGLKAGAAEQAMKDWEDACDRFCRTRGALAWASPQTDSRLNPSYDRQDSLPYFDPDSIGNMVPNEPGPGPYFGETTDDDRE